MKLVYLKAALRDVESIRTYIGRDDPEVAKRVVALIERSAARLERLP